MTQPATVCGSCGGIDPASCLICGSIQPAQPLDLDPIQARADAATPGPWGHFDGNDYADVAADYQQTGRGSYSSRQQVARIEADWCFDDPQREDWDEDDAAAQAVVDAEFIAAARTDVPALVAEIRRLRTELAGMTDLKDRALTKQDTIRAELEQYTALDLGAPDGRVSASCDTSEHPTWLRKPDDTRGCPWCELEPYESMSGQACESGVHPDWLANIDEQLACPWCLIAQQRYIIAALRQAANGRA